MGGGAEARVVCADGIGLCCRIWTPTSPGPWPVLLMRQPYGSRIASTVTYAHPQWYADQGFAVVVQDVRGCGASEGQFAGFIQEPADANATMAWLRAQPWCNGRVGTYGFSYQGLSQLLHADDPLPDALAPAMAGLDERLHWASQGACHWWVLSLAWGLQLAAQRCRRLRGQDGWQAIRRSLDSGAFVHEGLALLRRYDPEGMVLGWLERDPRRPQDWPLHRPPAALWQRPMLLIGGWHDPHLSGVLDLWRQAFKAGSSPLLRIGAWSHLQWNGGIDRLQLAFFKRHLGADHVASDPRPVVDQDLALPVVLQDLISGAWQQHDPQQCSGPNWVLHSDGLAAVDADEGRLLPAGSSGSGRVVVVHDPWRPVPGRGGHLGLDPGLVDRADLDRRCDVACFTSAPLLQPLQLLGAPELRIDAVADQSGFDLCVALSQVTAAGAVRQLSTGVARWLGDGCRLLQPRRVLLQPLLATLEPGSSLRLSIALAAWPQIAVNPGTGATPRGGSSPDHQVITVVLQLSGSSLSMIPMLGAN